MNWITWAFSKISFTGARQRFLFQIFDRHHQDGITIYADPADGPVAEVHARIAAIRRLIERIDPARARRLPTLLPNFAVMNGVRTQFWAATQTCVYERDFLVRAPDDLVACIIVHEAAHARLYRRGIKTTPRCQGRVEAVCNPRPDRVPEAPAARRVSESRPVDRALRRLHCRGAGDAASARLTHGREARRRRR